MKYVTIILFILFYCLSQFSLLSNAGIGTAPPHPLRKPGGCYDTTYGHLEGGKDYRLPARCISMACLSSGEIVFRSCTSLGVPPNCITTKIDFSKPFSDCCPRLYCEDGPIKNH